ncbi:MAG: hypothetical protein WC061_09400 [Melioribacteraceae bacterium]
MLKLNLLPKIFLFLAILFFAVFLGSYISRQMLVYQLFEQNGIDFKSIYNNDNLPFIYATLVPAFILNIAGYYSFMVSFLVFLFSSKIRIKYEGWLFAIIIIVAVTAPFEIYLSTIDLKISQMILSESATAAAVSALVQERMSALSSFPLIEVFSFAAIIFLSVFQPLRKKYED